MIHLLRIVLPLVVLTAALAGAWGLSRLAEEPERTPHVEAPPAVRLLTAKPGEHRVFLESRGTIQSRATAVVTAGVAGEVIWLAEDLANGIALPAGIESVRIDPVPFETAVANAAAALAQARLQAAREAALAAQAARDWARHGEGEADPLVLREPQATAAREQVRAAEAALQRARHDLERTVVRAPFAGRVLGKQVELGQQLAPGQALFRLQASDAVEVVLPLSRREARLVELPLAGEPAADGAAVELRTPSDGVERVWRGRIHRVLAEIDPVTRMLRVVVRVEGTVVDGVPLLPGSFVEARIAGRVLAGTVTLPSELLHHGDRLYLCDAEYRLRERRVEVVQRRDGRVLVRGLNAGERVLATVLAEARPGLEVTVTAEPEADDAPVDDAVSAEDAGP